MTVTIKQPSKIRNETFLNVESVSHKRVGSQMRFVLKHMSGVNKADDTILEKRTQVVSIQEESVYG